MTEELFFDGARYISAADAARSSKLTRDYIARLAREGRIIGKVVGRQWYVSESSLSKFQVSQELSSTERRNALISERLQEYSQSQNSALGRTLVGTNQVSTTASAPVAEIAIHRKLAEAVTRTGEQISPRIAYAPSESSSRSPISPFTSNAEFVNKLVAGVLALALVIGLYSSQGSLAALFPQLTGSSRVTNQVASAADAVSGTFGAIESAVSSLFSPFFGANLAQTGEKGTITVRIVQKPQAVQQILEVPQQKTYTPTPTKSVETIIENPIIQKLVETQPLAVSGGISEGELDQRLQQLTNSLTEQIALAYSANATTIAQNYNVTAQTNRIDQLNGTTITSPSISGGSISNTNISGGTISGATFSGTTTLQGLAVSGTGTSSYSGGISITGGCVSVNGACIGAGGAANPAGSDTQVEFNNQGAFGASSFFTFATSTETLAVLNATTSNFTTTNATTTNGTSTNLFVTKLGLGSALSVASGGTGTSTAPTYGQVLVGNSSGGYNLVATSSLGITSGGGSSNVSTSSQNTWSALQIFAGNASSSNFSNFGTAFFGGTATSSFNSTGQLTLANLSNAILGVSASGQVVATSSFGTNLLTGNLGTINGLALAAGGSITVTAASSTLLANNNLFSGRDTFSLINLSATSSGLLATDANGNVIATTTIGTNLLSANTISGVALGGTLANLSAGSGLSGSAYNGSATQAFSLNLANANNWTGLQTFQNASSTNFSTFANAYFGGSATSSFNSSGQLTLANLTNAVLGVNSSGQVVATSSIGTNLLTGNLGTVNGQNLTAGGSITVTAASSTLLSNNNTFSGNNLFSASTTFSNLININQSSTSLATLGTTWLTGLSNALLSVDNNGKIIASSTIGTNLLTANTISGVALGGNLFNLSATDGTLTFSGTYNGSTARTVGLNLGNANSWTALQQFNAAASTTQISVINKAFFGGSATTTIDSAGNVAVAGTLNVTGQTTLAQASSTAISVFNKAYFGGTATSSFSSNGALTLGSVLSCTGNQALQTDGSGNVSCGAITVSGASSGGGWTTNNTGRVSLSTTTDLVVVGATTTPYAKFTVISGSTATTTLAIVPASGQTANIFDIYNTSGALGSVFTAGGNLGLGTTSPAARLAVSGTAYITATTTLGATTTITGPLSLGTATTTASNGLNITAGCFSVNGTCVGSTSASSTLLSDNNTFTGNNLFTASTTFSNLININQSSTSLATFGSLYFSNLANAILSTNANGQVVSTSSIGVNYLTGTLGVGNGGTGSTTLTGILKGNGTGAIQSAVAGTDYQAPITASYPIQFSANNLSLAFGTTTANTWSALQTFNGGASTTNISASGEGYFATASTTNLIISGAPSGILQTNSSGTVSAGSVALGTQVSGILPVGNGGTGWANIAANTLLTGNGAGSLATTSVGAGLSLSGGSLSNSGVTSVNQTYGTNQTGAITLATSSSVSFNGLTLSHTITNSGGTFTFANTLNGTLNNSGLTNSTISGVALGGNLFNLSHDATLSGSSYNGSAAVSNWGLNLANANTWTSLQTFANASTTLFSAYGPAYFGGTATSSFGTNGALTLATALTVPNGGTGQSTFSSSQLLYGAGSGALQSIATSTLSFSGPFTTSGTLGSLVGGTNFTLTLPQANGSTNGYLASADWTTFNNKVSSTSLSATYPLAYTPSTGVFTLAFGTTTANTWSQLQTFNAGFNSIASSTIGNGTQAGGLTISGGATTTGTATFNNGLVVSGATSTFSNGITLSSGCVFYSGSCIGANSGTVSSGTQGQFAFYNTNGTTISATSSLFVTQAGQIGIGTTSPGIIAGATRYLTIDSEVSSGLSALELSGNTNASGAAIGRISFYNGIAFGGELARVSAVTVNNTDKGALVFSTANLAAPTEAARIDPLGNFGIGTTTPGSIFSVQGVGNFVASATSTLYNGLNLASGCFSIGGTCLATGVSSVSNSDGTLTISPTSGAVVASLALAHANTWTGLQQFTNASTTLFSAYGPAYFGATATSSFSSTGALTLANALTYGGVTLNNAVTGTGNLVLSASPTLTGTLTAAAANFSGVTSFTGLSSFNNASTSLLSVFSKAYFGGTATSTFDSAGNLSLVSNGLTVGTNQLIVSAGNVGIGTTSPGALLSVGGNILGNGTLALTGTTGTTTIASGQGFTIGGSQFVVQQGSGNVGIGTTTPWAKLSIHANNGDTNTTLFAIASSTASATTTLFSISNTGTITQNAIKNSLIAADNNGNLIASTTIGINLLTGTLATINGTGITAGGSATITAASSTLLADNNTFSGNDIFSNLLVLNGGLTAYASSTIGNGSNGGGLTISGGATTTGTAYFANQSTFLGAATFYGAISAAAITATNTVTVNVSTPATQSSGNGTTLNNSFLVQNGNGGNTSANTGTVVGGGGGSIKLTAGTGGLITGNPTNGFAGNGGDLTLSAGAGGFVSGIPTGTSDGGNGGNVTISGGGGGAGNTANGTGGNATLRGGASNGAGNTSGNVYVIGGAGNGGATAGNVFLGADSSGNIWGNIGIASTSPFANLSVQAASTSVNSTILAVGSTTSAGVNSTLFSVSNTGLTKLLNLSATGATTSALAISGISSGNLLKTTTGGAIIAAVAGTDYATPANISAAFPFTSTTFGSTAANATSTLIGFTNGLYALASSTIGNGTQAGGLTISGGATTTGALAIQQSGTAALPAIRLGGSATGFYSPSASTLGISANGSLIGDYGISNGSTWTLGNASLQGTVSWFGTSVTGNNGDVLRVSSTNNGTLAQSIINTSSGSSASSNLYFGNNTSASEGSLILNSSGNASGNGANSFTISGAAGLWLQAGVTNQLMLNTSGNVGIGTSTPWAKLSLHANNGETNTTLFAIASSTANATTTLFSISNTGVINLNPAAQTGDKLALLNSQNFFSATTSSNGFLALGYQAGQSLLATSTAAGNTVFGYQALMTATSSLYNTAIGYQVLKNANDYAAQLNTGLGYIALSNNTIGQYNTALGAEALLNNTTGSSNAAIGTWAMQNNTTGHDDVGLGQSALAGNITGLYNSAVGSNALTNNASATNTVAVGTNSGKGTATYSNQGGTYVGAFAGQGLQTGSDYNILLGFQSGYNLTTGSNNLILASATSSNAIANLTTGSQNILIGNNISLPSATANGQLNIGNILYGTAITGTGSTISSGSIGIGTTTPWAKLSVTGPDTTTGYAFVAANSGNSPVFSIQDNGIFTYSKNSTSTILNNTAYAWTIATSSTASPLFKIDSTTGSETVSIGAAGSDVYIGDTGASPNLVFQNSGQTIKTASGGTINIGAGTDAITFGGSGQLLAGTTTAGSSIGKLVITSGTTPQLALGDGTAGDNLWTFRNTGGQLFLATSTYSATSSVSAFQLDTNGDLIIRGAATTCTIGNGTAATNCSSSDQRLKTNITTLTATSGLASLMQLNPVSFNWSQWMQSIGNSSTTQFGLIAQQVQNVFPNLVHQDDRTGYYTLDYQGLEGPLLLGEQQLNGVFSATQATTSAPTILSLFQGTTTPITIDQFGDLGIGTSTATTTTNLQLCLNGSCIASFPYATSATSSTSIPQFAPNFLDALKQAIVGYLADAANGIHDIYANIFHAQEVDTQTLCVTDSTGAKTCLTKAQLDALIAGAAGSASTSTATTSTTTAPILQINGNNPATVNVGTTYSDLGATITGPTPDLNLGIKASVDGATSTPISDIHIDTSKAGTHTITYSATDQNGVTGSAVRTLVVVDSNAKNTATSTSPTSPTATSTTTATSSQGTSTSTSAATSSPSTTTTSASSSTLSTSTSTSTSTPTTSSTSTSAPTMSTSSKPIM